MPLVPNIPSRLYYHWGWVPPWYQLRSQLKTHPHYPIMYQLRGWIQLWSLFPNLRLSNHKQPWKPTIPLLPLVINPLLCPLRLTYPLSIFKLCQSNHYLITIRPARHTYSTRSPYSHAVNFLPYVPPLHSWNIVIDQAIGCSLQYRHIVESSDTSLWPTSFVNELGRLAQDVGTRIPTDTHTIYFIARKAVYARRTTTYCLIIAIIRPKKEETRHVLLTIGGHRINYSGDKSTPTAKIETIKDLLNSTISTPNATFSASYINDFYLNVLANQHHSWRN